MTRSGIVFTGLYIFLTLMRFSRLAEWSIVVQYIHFHQVIHTGNHVATRLQNEDFVLREVKTFCHLGKHRYLDFHTHTPTATFDATPTSLHMQTWPSE